MTGSTRLMLVRHGRTDWNLRGRLQGSADIPLDDVGRAQARAAARSLDGHEWDIVVTSPLARAVETGRIIAAHLKIVVSEQVPELAERSYGVAEGLTRADAERRWPGGSFPGLEPLGAVAMRGVHALRSVVAAHPGGRVVVVAHGALIRAVLGELTGGPVPRIVNGALSELEWAGRWTVHSMNRIGATTRPDAQGSPRIPVRTRGPGRDGTTG
ncbi:MAG: histidine phosphatase family protein [Rhodococcus sp. (in: high G+C Gram-positive bacteria)]|uniref:histidine phosphatase family protein n=1 Tax=Rhodococcus sp. TaxID=1831 RepID=UPI003BB7F1AF